IAAAFCFQTDLTAGQCWPFPGSRGHVVIKLPALVWPAALAVQHIPKEHSPSGSVSSAPKDIAVLGLDDEGDATLLGTFVYDIDREVLQLFPLTVQQGRVDNTREEGGC
ncbi:SUN1 protein, partial [Crypturellus undulatus]|nr:SUN1 protein [Crypturellus undulatus]